MASNQTPDHPNDSALVVDVCAAVRNKAAAQAIHRRRARAIADIDHRSYKAVERERWKLLRAHGAPYAPRRTAAEACALCEIALMAMQTDAAARGDRLAYYTASRALWQIATWQFRNAPGWQQRVPA